MESQTISECNRPNVRRPLHALQRSVVTRKPAIQNLRRVSQAGSNPQATENLKLPYTPTPEIPSTGEAFLVASGYSAQSTGLPAPKYDRAFQLGELYRALLPDITLIDDSPASSIIMSEDPQIQSSNHSTVPVSPLSRDSDEYGDEDSAASPRTATSSITTVEDDTHQSAAEQAYGREIDEYVLNECQGTYSGLQNCLDLFTDELVRKHFLKHHPKEDGAKASKLQFLLLIESYEAMLDLSRKKLLQWSDVDDIRYLPEGIEIISCWLHSLYRTYDDIFP
jgi:hypothetical protein